MPFKDPARQKIAVQQEYQRHKYRFQYRLIGRRVDRQRFIYEYLLKHPCVDCGESDPIVLQYDHVRGQKKFEIADGGRRCFSIENLKTEIAKCEVRCANCHHKKTYHERGCLHRG